jgi:hypothetical protein
VTQRQKLALVVVLVLLGFAAYVQIASAYAVCVNTYMGDCLSSSGCDYFDDDTNAFRGGVRVHYHCPPPI